MLQKDDAFAISSQMHGELQGKLGKNFDLYKQAANVVERRPRASVMSKEPPKGVPKPFKHHPAFPPLLSSFTLRQTKQAPPKNIKPIRMTPALKDELLKTLGDKNVKMIQHDIGFSDKPANEIEVIEENPPPVFSTVWGASARRPDYKFSSKPHVTKIHGKFYWPNQTNSEATIPVAMKLPSEVRDLKSWLQTYGEPSPDRIPTGFLTTFRPSGQRVGREKSRGSSMIREATGVAWKQQLDATRKLAQTS